MCMTCGYVGCCDKAKNRHMARHFDVTGHPVIRPYREPGMDWLWCRVDQTLLDSER
jgi:monovalent cation/hydrogen antiporter